MMELTDAYLVAKAIAECWDPPVIEGIFMSLDESFPHLKFEYCDRMKVKVTDISKGIPIVIKDPDDEPI